MHACAWWAHQAIAAAAAANRQTRVARAHLEVVVDDHADGALAHRTG